MYGQRIKQLRKDYKMTAKVLGQKLNLAESTISGYENETRKPDIDTFERIADIFMVSVDYLMGRTDNQEKDLSKQLLDAADNAKKMQVISEQVADFETGVGRAFFGGSDKYSEEELEIARAAAKAAIEAFRKVKKQQNK
ncbi:helix-turn-helix domain-containing protein [Paenibacillus sp. MMS18-CY102]|uniref:helix-turn-helix domain-containing protein n=1 Tax=Paenibacillus sp. MMS18-CY102 TaxID=2682849 RepID=UPI001365B48E|nr:helix-turn-helix transcriptional regulator [Paenibacillus sp. MMS18-CY102]MWC26662.1 helix-turn-helix domain-containing protein [Paenibacillus sp. MMS18-CY102]